MSQILEATEPADAPVRRPAEAPRAVRFTALALEIALAAVLAVLAARLVWTIAAPDAFAPRSTGPEAAPAQAAAQARGAQDWSVLWRVDPFSRLDGAADDAVRDAPETTLNLDLNGVRAGFDAEGGVAFITLPDNSQGTFQEGAEILDGVTLERVYHDRIILRRNGVAESLYLDGERTLFGAQTPPDAAPRPDSVGAEAVSVETVLGRLDLAPAYEGARFQGLQVRGRDAAALEPYGLQPGDIIESVGGVRLAEDGDPSVIADMFDAGEPVALVISRDGDRLDRRIELGSGVQ